MAKARTPRAVATPAIHHVDVPGYPGAHSPYSHAVVANGFVFVSGQIPVRPGGGPTDIAGDTMQEQTRQALRNVETILKAAGSSLDRVVKITVLLARPDLYREMNAAYAEFFPGRSRRARWPVSVPTSLVCSSPSRRSRSPEIPSGRERSRDRPLLTRSRHQPSCPAPCISAAG